jgi:hypothetical protein
MACSCSHGLLAGVPLPPSLLLLLLLLLHHHPQQLDKPRHNGRQWEWRSLFSGARGGSGHLDGHRTRHSGQGARTCWDLYRC